MNKQITVHATAASRTVAAVILATPIRRDTDGRYCLNDLHRAAGSQPKHLPFEFMRSPSTAELVEVLITENPRNKPVETSKGRYGGTYVVEDLALTYAMWISPRFHLEVLRGFKESRRDRATDVGIAIVPAGTSLTTLLEMALDSERARIELEAQIELERPKVEFSEATMADERTTCLRDAGKQFGVSDQKLIALLIDKGVLYRKGKSLFPYQPHIDSGHFCVKSYAVAKDYVVSRPHVTGKGLLMIHRLLQQRALN